MPNNPDHIIVHCSDSPYGCAELIRGWHLQRGFTGCGYHAVILNGRPFSGGKYFKCFDGMVEPGRRPEEIGAHCLGFNARSLGVCLIGKAEFTQPQLFSLRRYIWEMQDIYGVDNSRIKGHYEFCEHKTCPNMPGDVIREYVAGKIRITDALKEIAEWNKTSKKW